PGDRPRPGRALRWRDHTRIVPGRGPSRHPPSARCPGLTVSRRARPRLSRPPVPLDQYVSMKHISRMLDRELKKGSAELLILSLVEARPRHGYEISKLIEERSGGRLKFKVASLYPLLYRLEERGWIIGKWIEKAGERRRRFYRL